MFTFSAYVPFATGVDPNSVAVGDFNGDGKPDIVVADSRAQSVSVLVNMTTPKA